MYKYTIQDGFGPLPNGTVEATNLTEALEAIKERLKSPVKVIYCYYTMAVLACFQGSVCTKTYGVTWKKVKE